MDHTRQDVDAAPDAQSGEVSLPWSKRVIATDRLVPEAQTLQVDDLVVGPAMVRAWRKEIADLRRHLERAQGAEADLAAMLIRAETAEQQEKVAWSSSARWQEEAERLHVESRDNEAALAAEQLRCKVTEERRDALSGELAAERAAREAAERASTHHAELALSERSAKEAAEGIVRLLQHNLLTKQISLPQHVEQAIRSYK